MDIPNNEKKKCAEIQLRRYISKTVGYPEEALLRGDQGTVYVRFVVMEDGHIAQVELVKNMTESQALAEVSIHAVKSMNELEQRWIPGYQNGRAVRVRIVVPIKFKLTNDEPRKKKKWWQRLSR